MTPLDRYLPQSIATESDLHWEQYQQPVLEAGCPRDQLRRFLRAGYVAQPKQLLFHAACREADQDGGPTEIGMGGARGGAKSHALIAQMVLDDCMRRDGLKCLLLRKVGKAVRESFGDLRRKVLGPLPHQYLRGDAVLKLSNGSRVILGHFQHEKDINAYLGLEYDIVGVEEATTLAYAKYRDIRTCCRTSRDDWRARTYSNANPGGVGHAWYKQRFIQPARSGSDNNGNTRFIFSTVDDNVYLDEEYRKTLEDLVGWKKRAWLYGDWDIAAGQYFTNFRSDQHVVDAFPVPSHWHIWLSMDYGFGVTHWNVIHLLGEDLRGHVFVIAELAHRKTLVPTIAEDLRAMLARWEVDVGRLWQFRLGSDAFTRRGETGTSIADQWRAEGFYPEKANMDRINGAAEMLRRLGDFDAGIQPSLWIFRNCKRLAECLPSLEHDPHRPEDVLKVAASEDGIGGDDCFVAGTPILTRQGEIPIELVRAGDEVLTRAGWKPVIAAWQAHRNSTVLRALFSDGRELAGTPNHPLWVANKGWVHLDFLRYGDIMESIKSNPFYNQLRAQKWPSQNVSNLMGSNSGAIRILRTMLIAAITRLMRQLDGEVFRRYIRKSGKPIMAPSLKGITFITSMAMRSITQLRTWYVSQLNGIMSIMATIPESWHGYVNMLLRFDRLLPLGIHPLRGWNGTVSMVRKSLQTDRRWMRFASNVKSPIPVEILMRTEHVFARINAGLPGDGQQAQMILNGFAQSVANVSVLIDTKAQSIAAENVEQSRASVNERTSREGRGDTPVYLIDIQEVGKANTYALHVADQHEYYANSLLVRNCYDALRYGLMCVARGGALEVGVSPVGDWRG